MCVTSELSEPIAASPSLLTMHPRLYQEELLEKAKEYLGTGSGKTFIAVMLIKHMRDLLGRSKKVVLGVPSVWEINDVYRLDPELLMMLLQPVFALMLLFPITEKYYDYQKDQEAAIFTQTVSSKLLRG